MRNATLLLGAVLVSVLSACASSREGDGSDTDVDTDTDADTDSDSDADSDSDDACECTSTTSPCCDGCNYYGPDHVCDVQHDAVTSCANAGSCGDEILVSYRPQYCSGDASLCTGAIGDASIDGGVAEACGSNETCANDGDAGAVACQLDLVTCPVGFGDRVCQEGGVMADCGTFSTECAEPHPTLDESLDVAAFGTGEVVKLELASTRVTGPLNKCTPYTDITMTVSHGGTVAQVYSGYRGVVVTAGHDYQFPTTWYLPQFSGMEMGGDWTVHFEDGGFSGQMAAVPFDLTQWCVTFLDPATTAPVTSGVWTATETGDVDTSSIDATLFEMQIDDIVDATGQTPWLELDLSPADAYVTITLTAADGTIIPVKSEFDADVPATVAIEDLTSTWLTGRWSLAITDWGSSVTPTLNGWSIHLGDLPTEDAGVDSGS